MQLLKFESSLASLLPESYALLKSSNLSTLEDLVKGMKSNL